jgi:hypothetical protein
MKHAGSVALRTTTLRGGASARPVKRRGFLKRLMAALHRSRRRQAQHLVRRYRYLMAEDYQCQVASAYFDFNNELESSRNANADQGSAPIHRRRRHNA